MSEDKKPLCIEIVNGVPCGKEAKEGLNHCEEHDPSHRPKPKGGGAGGGGWFGKRSGPVYSPRMK